MVDLYDFYNCLKEDGIIFCFSGPTSQSVLEGIGEALKQRIEQEDPSKSVARKVFSVFVEQVQNVINYSAEKISGTREGNGELRHGVVIVGHEKGKFYVLSGNTIERTIEDRLAKNLRALQKMDKVQLKDYFRKQRKKESDLWSKGAGLGLIETARKASEPLEFDIKPVDEKFAFFTIKAYI